MKAYYPSLESLESRELLSTTYTFGGRPFTPAQIRDAYGFTQAFHQYGNAAKGQGVTVAVVIAMDAPHAAKDLATYDRRYHLPKADITTFNLGGTGNGGAWYGFTTEAAIDVEVVHALLPLAKIDLVEAKTPWMGDLGDAVQYAASLPGVDIVSNSWGLVDSQAYGFYPAALIGSAFKNPNVTYVAAVGDSSGPLWYPGDSPNVVGVGGTILTHKGNHYQQRPWLSYTAGLSNPVKTGPDVLMIGGLPGVSIFGPPGFLSSVWGHAIGTSVSAPAFGAVVGVVDGIRLSQGKSPLTTSQVLVGLTPGEIPWVPNFIDRFA